MKILLINLPYYGHVVPTIGLVQELIKKGCEVTYLMPYDWQERIEESGAHFHGYPNHKQLSEQIKNAYAEAEKIIEDFDLVLYEQFFFLGIHLAEKYHKPVVRIFTAPVTNDKLMKEYISAKGPLSIFKWKWIAKAFTKDIARNIPLQTDNWLDEIVYHPPQLNLVYTLKEYQPYVSEFDENQYKFIGPSIYERKEGDISYIKKDKPLVYISLGTIVEGAKSFYQNCIEAFRNEYVDVIISVGKKFNLNKLKNIPDNIHIYPFVPQLKVLKITDVFITHGGMNSISEALYHGVPMVVIPFTADQPVNARRIEQLKLGKTLDYSTLNKDVIKECVNKVLEDNQIKNNLIKIQNDIKEAPGNTGAVDLIIQYYEKCSGL